MAELRRSGRKQKIYALTRNYEALGRHLQKMRLHAKLTQREVGDALGYSSAQFISNFERGIVKPPVEKLKMLIRLYEMPPERLINLIIEGHKEQLKAFFFPDEARNAAKRS
jgi:transcriptional regulator with XRE-family HTH domain